MNKVQFWATVSAVAVVGGVTAPIWFPVGVLYAAREGRKLIKSAEARPCVVPEVSEELSKEAQTARLEAVFAETFRRAREHDRRRTDGKGA